MMLSPLRKSWLSRNVFSSSEKPNVKGSIKKRCYTNFVTTGGRSSVSGAIVTVFGNTGFLGRYVVNSLGSIGSQVVIPFRGDEYVYNHLKVMGDLGQIIPIPWDIRDPDTIYEAVKHSDAVVNLTSAKWPTRNFSLEDVNIKGAKRIADISRAAGVKRLIHLSIAGTDVDSDCNFLRTKSIGEEQVKEAFPSATILKPTILCGMEDLFTVKIAYQMRYWPIVPLLYPERKVQPVYVNDVARAITSCIKDGTTAGKTFELGGNEIWTHEDIYEYCLSFLKLKPRIAYGQEALVELMYRFIQHTRTPKYTPDLLKLEKLDRVVQEGSLGFEDLGIEQDTLTSFEKNLPIFIRRYRKPIRFDEGIEVSYSGEVTDPRDL